MHELSLSGQGNRINEPISSDQYEVENEARLTTGLSSLLRQLKRRVLESTLLMIFFSNVVPEPEIFMSTEAYCLRTSVVVNSTPSKMFSSESKNVSRLKNPGSGGSPGELTSLNSSGRKSEG